MDNREELAGWLSPRCARPCQRGEKGSRSYGDKGLFSALPGFGFRAPGLAKLSAMTGSLAGFANAKTGFGF